MSTPSDQPVTMPTNNQSNNFDVFRNFFKERMTRIFEVFGGLGWHFFPLKEGKKPLTRGSWKTFKFNGDTLHLLGDTRFTGLGISCGAVSGIMVIDIDVGKTGKKNGVEWWNEVAAPNFDPVWPIKTPDGLIHLPGTFCTRTGSGGIHIYFRYPGKEAGLTSNSLPGISVDIRSDGGYVVAPYSYHPDKKITYAPGADLINGVIPCIMECPPKLIAILSDLVHSSDKYPHIASSPVVVSTNVNKERVPQNGYPPMKFELVFELIDLISSEYSVGYDTWLRGVWAIEDVARNSGWSYEEGRFLAHKFASKAGDKYDANATESLWKQRANSPKRPNRPTMGTLFHWLYQGGINQSDLRRFHKKWELKVIPRMYDFDDPYYISTYKKEYVNRHFTSREEAWESCVKSASRFARLIEASGGKGPIFIVKTDRENLFEERKRNLVGKESRMCLTYDIPKIDKRGNLTFIKAKMNIFEPFDDVRLICSRLAFFPYSPLQKDPVQDTVGEDGANRFRGCKARYLPDNEYDPKIIQKLLDHIKNVWAKGDDRCYKYILDWFAYAFQNMMSPQPALVIIGGEGCGKSIIGKFLRNKVYGKEISRIGNCLGVYTGRFNGSLENNCFYGIDETAIDEGVRCIKAAFEKLKGIISENEMDTELKGKEVRRGHNFNKTMIFSNHDDCLMISKNDRRFAIFDCSNDFVGKFDYFDEIVELLNQQTAGDTFYTFGLKREVTRRDLIELLDTHGRREMIRNGMNDVEKYVTDIQEGSWRIQPINGYDVIVQHKDGLFVGFPDLSNDFSTWCSRHNVKKKYTNFARLFARCVEGKGKYRPYVNGNQECGYFINQIAPNTYPFPIPSVQLNNGMASNGVMFDLSGFESTNSCQ